MTKIIEGAPRVALPLPLLRTECGLAGFLGPHASRGSFRADECPVRVALLVVESYREDTAFAVIFASENGKIESGPRGPLEGQ